MQSIPQDKYFLIQNCFGESLLLLWNVNFSNTFQSLFYFINIFILQTSSLGALLDLRTLMHALLNPTESRDIMSKSQEMRRIYFQMRIAYIFTNCYLEIKLILSQVLERRIVSGVHDFEHVDPDDFIALRKLAMKRRKPCLGRIIHEWISHTVERRYRRLYRTRFILNDITEVPDESEIEDQESLEPKSSRRSSRNSTLSNISSIRSIPSKWNKRYLKRYLWQCFLPF